MLRFQFETLATEFPKLVGSIRMTDGTNNITHINVYNFEWDLEITCMDSRLLVQLARGFKTISMAG